MQISGAKKARLECRVADRGALLRISNDGTEMHFHSLTSAGLDCIRNEVASLNGTFKIATVAAARMVIEASIPIN